MRPLSLRVRIVGVFVLIYGALFVLLLGWMMQHIEKDFLSEIDENLRVTATELETVLRRGPEAVDSLREALANTGSLISLHQHIWLWNGDSIVYRCAHVPFPPSQELRRDTLHFFTHAAGAEWYRIVQKRERGFALQVAEQVTAMEHTLEESVILILLSIPVVIVLSFAGGYYLVRRLLQPLDAITQRADRISSENLNERIALPGPDDEIARVVRTLNRMIERLEDSFAQLEQFTANVSHELRTPLTILQGEMEILLQQQRDPEEYRTVIESNLEEIRRVSKTVETLFMLARIDHQELTLEREHVDLIPLLEVTAAEIAPRAAERGVRIDCDLRATLPIIGDGVMLAQVFLNLLENAIKYNRMHGRVILRLQEKPGEVRIDVTDTGIGIPAEEKERIFDRFYRVDKQFSRQQGGAGLGLSLARQIVELHGGTITVQSTPGKGSTFSIVLPGMSQ